MTSLYLILKRVLKQKMSDNIQKTNKAILTINRLQFIGEFFVFSKVKQNSSFIPEFLMTFQAIKFYLKSIAISQSKGIYLQNTRIKKPLPDPIKIVEQDKSTIDEQIQREQKILDLIRSKPYQSMDYYPEMMQKFASGKKMQMMTTKKLPKQLERDKISIRQISGQILTVLRPLISIICIKIYGIESYKSYLISLLIDLAILIFFQKTLKIKSIQEKQEIMGRRKEMIKRYLFRKPFYNVIKRLLIIPLLGKIIKPQRAISGFILSFLDMQSSISLTL